MPNDWTKTLAEDLWLKPDDVGAEEAAFILKALHLRSGQSVLDAPCGAGRIAVHVARHGCSVTGVDLRRSFTDRALARFRREKLQGRFIVQDLRQMEFQNEFHGIYSWSGSFGYFSESENLDLMRRYANALRKGGRLLIDQPNREHRLRHFVANAQHGNTSTRNHWNARTERIDSDWVVERNGKKEHNRMSICLYTRSQMAGLFRQAGLQVEAMYGSSEGEPYVRSSKRLIVVGRKQGGPPAF